MRRIVCAIIAASSLSGCFGELWAIRTIEDIQKSEYTAKRTSTQSADVVTRCMMERLHGYDDKGRRPFAEVVRRDIGRTQELTVRSPRIFAAGLYDAGGELLVLIENVAQESGTASTVWTHQYMLAPKDFFGSVTTVTQPCL